MNELVDHLINFANNIGIDPIHFFTIVALILTVISVFQYDGRWNELPFYFKLHLKLLYWFTAFLTLFSIVDILINFL